MAEFAHPMSLGSLARFMNLPEEDEARWFDWVERMFSNALLDKADQREAVHEAEAYIDALIAERKRKPRDDFIGLLLKAEVDGHRLSDAEVRQFGVLMLLAGLRDDVGRDGHEPAAPRGAPRAARAAVRRRRRRSRTRRSTSSCASCRRSRSSAETRAHDVELHGETIPAGDVVLLAYGSANHDPRAFDEPERCVLDRHPNRHVAFGHGRHLCLGANLARLELTIMLERFAVLFPDFRVDPERAPAWKPRGDVRALASLNLLAGS